ncbi:MAG: hypothetical protein N2112_04630 [Gemmataceae bacterium]|jgi:hypothetical protein|nr:hypothetical protein [Gemmataceae bacterium]
MLRLLALTTILGTSVLASNVLAQDRGERSREIAPEATTFDKEDVWTLHFEFQDPRIIVEKVPGRGNKIIWYMLYWVSNRDPKGDVHTFIPDIELVTLDRFTTHTDEILPSVEKAIRQREDPFGKFNIKNSVTISEEPIPVSKKDAFPKRVAGVAIWTDVDPAPGTKDKIDRTNKFSIFVAGLSNGWAEEKKADGTRVIKRKTLQLDFERLGDGERIEPSGIRWTGGATWIYRQTTGVGTKEPDVKEPKEPLKKEEIMLKPRFDQERPSQPSRTIVEPIPALPAPTSRRE